MYNKFTYSKYCKAGAGFLSGKSINQTEGGGEKSEVRSQK